MVMSHSREDTAAQIFMFNAFREFMETETAISNKAKNLADIIEPVLQNTAHNFKDQPFLLEAYKHVCKLAAHASPFGDLTAANLGDIAARMIEVDNGMNDPERNAVFKQRAVAMIWLALHYAQLTATLRNYQLLSTQTDNDLAAPLQRITKFNLFAESTTAAVNKLPATIFSDDAKNALSRLRVRSLNIAFITNELIRETTHNQIMHDPALLGELINQSVTQMLLGVEQEALHQVIVEAVHEANTDLLARKQQNSNAFFWVNQSQENDSESHHAETSRCIVS
jgi:hypothetical protein